MKIRSVSIFICFTIVFSCVFSTKAEENVSSANLYTIDAVYCKGNEICAVDIIKNGDFESRGNVIIISASAQDSGALKRVRAVPVPDDTASGVFEISTDGFVIGENEDISVFVWDSFKRIKPLTNGVTPSVTVERERIVGKSGQWQTAENGKRLCAYLGSDTDVTVPNYYEGKHITKIGAITNSTERKSLFGDRAKEITSVTVPRGIKQIGYTCFYDCENLSGELKIPDTVTYIGTGAFFSCGKISGDLKIPNSVTVIAPMAFAYCTSLSSLELGEGLYLLGDYAFCGCSGLSGSLKIPQGVAAVRSYTFAGCSGLNGTLDISGVTYIGEAAFASCKKLSGNLEFSDALTHIGAVAFENCSSLSGELILPESLNYIGDYAFNHCSGFTNETLKIPRGITVLGGDYKVSENTDYGAHMFYDFGKDSFASFEIQGSGKTGSGEAANGGPFYTEIGVLFSKSGRLIAYPRGKRNKVYKIPQQVHTLDELCFGQNRYLKEIVLPDGFEISTEIPKNAINSDANTLSAAIYNYTGIERVTAAETNKRYISENGILYSADKKSFWYCPTGFSGTVNVADGTERIEKGAFYGAAGNVKYTSLNIPKSVKFIDENTMKAINSLLKGNITVDSENPYFTVSDGIIKAVK